MLIFGHPRKATGSIASPLYPILCTVNLLLCKLWSYATAELRGARIFRKNCHVSVRTLKSPCSEGKHATLSPWNPISSKELEEKNVPCFFFVKKWPIAALAFFECKYCKWPTAHSHLINIRLDARREENKGAKWDFVVKKVGKFSVFGRKDLNYRGCKGGHKREPSLLQLRRFVFVNGGRE